MATVREGDRAALLVVDVQHGVLRNAWNREGVVARLAAVLGRARSAGAPVVWVRHEDADLPRGSEDWRWVEGIAPAPGEREVAKRHNSAFEDTGLEPALAAVAATRVVLAGAATNWCIRATAYAALERGYDLTLVADAHTTESLALEDGTVIGAETLVRDLNVAMAWLSYPGRRNESVPAARVDFAPRGPAVAPTSG